MKRLIVVMLAILIGVMLIACAAPMETPTPAPPEVTPTPTPEETAPTPPKEPPAPPAFTVSDLSISPTEVNTGNKVTISVLVTNTGDLTGSYEVTLKIDNNVVATKEVTLEGGASETVTFVATPSVAGTYNVSADELTGTFTAKIPPPAFKPIVITGSGDKTSPPFTVPTKEWVINWAYVPNPEYPGMAVFGFFVYPRGKTAGSVVSVSFAEESGSTYSYAGAGEYYIQVIAANIKSWEVVISPP